jgi:hypothetical protein
VRQGKYDCWSAGLQRSLASNISTKRKADFQKRIHVSDLKVDVKISRFRGFEISRFQSGVVRFGRVESEFEFRFEQCS